MEMQSKRAPPALETAKESSLSRSSSNHYQGEARTDDELWTSWDKICPCSFVYLKIRHTIREAIEWEDEKENKQDTNQSKQMQNLQSDDGS